MFFFKVKFFILKLFHI